MSKQNEQFLTIIDSHKRLIYKVVRAYVKDNHEHEDLAQEIIMQLWTSFEKYNEEFKLSTWIYRIALNTAISHYRKTTKRQENTTMISSRSIQTISEEDPYREDDNLRLLNHFIQELKEIDKAIILLHLDNMSQKEIAEIIGLSPSNVGTKLSRIKHRIREKFQSQTKSKNGR